MRGTRTSKGRRCYAVKAFERLLGRLRRFLIEVKDPSTSLGLLVYEGHDVIGAYQYWAGFGNCWLAAVMRRQELKQESLTKSRVGAEKRKHLQSSIYR